MGIIGRIILFLFGAYITFMGFMLFADSNAGIGGLITPAIGIVLIITAFKKKKSNRRQNVRHNTYNNGPSTGEALSRMMDKASLKRQIKQYEDEIFMLRHRIAGHKSGFDDSIGYMAETMQMERRMHDLEDTVRQLKNELRRM